MNPCPSAWGAGLLAALLLGSAAATVQDGQPLIQIEAPAHAEEEANFRVPSVVELNRFTFAGNVLRSGEQQHAEHWVVIFCPKWWEPCEQMVAPFGQLAYQWQSRLNHDLLVHKVRFASVDCATDKVLCNEQDVDMYPTVRHYMGGAKTAKWSGGQKNDKDRLANWLDKEFDKVSGGADTQGSATRSVMGFQEALSQYLVPGERAADVLIVLVGLAASFRLVLCNPELWEKPPEPPASSAAAAARGYTSVGRLLPEEWARSRPSLEL